MNTKLWLVLVVLLSLTLPCAGFGQSSPHVESFTISGSVIGGSTQTATAVVKIADPGNYDNGIVFSNGAFGIICDRPIPVAHGCYTRGDTLQVKLIGLCTTQNLIVPITASVADTWDTGKTAYLNLSPFHVGLNLPPVMTSDQRNGTATVTLDGQTDGSLQLFLDCQRLGCSYYGVTIPDGGSSAEFNIVAATASTEMTGSVTVTSGCVATQSGTVDILPISDPGTGPCNDCAQAGHPINVKNGNVWIKQQDYSLPGLGGGLSLQRTWNSLIGAAPGMFGNGWSSNLEARVEIINTETARVWTGDGNAWVFKHQNDQWTLVSPPDSRATLAFDASTTLYTLTAKDGTRRIFNNAGYLTQAIDRNGNATTFTYGDQNLLSRVADAGGRWLSFTSTKYNGLDWRIGSVADAVGTIATYSYDSSGRLTRVTYSDTSVGFNYDSGFITSVVDGAGKVLEAHTYYSGRGLTSERANGVDKVTLSYVSPGLTRITDSLGNTTDYTYKAINGAQYLTSVTGPGCSSCGARGNTTYTYDSNGNLLSVTDGLGRVTSYAYDTAGNVITKSIGGRVQ